MKPTLQEGSLKMSEILLQSKKEEERRLWATEGLAKFSETVRNHQESFEKLTDETIRFLAKYMNAQQGSLFIYRDENEADTYLELISCYAFNRKKYLEKRIDPGAGLVGQAFLEKETILLTQIPNGYTHITSGLGDATPTCLVIVPLKYNGHVAGIVELAGFEIYTDYQLSFLEKAGEFIASAIMTVKTTEKTNRLLEQSQIQTEHMRSQEEEMRQNMEELAATQEEMTRVFREVQENEQYMKNLIDASHDSVITFDHNYTIIHYNEAAKASYAAANIYIEGKNVNILAIAPDKTLRETIKQDLDMALSGKTLETRFSNPATNTEYIIRYIPIRDRQGEIMAVAQFSTDITALARAQQETEKLLAAATQQTEQLQSQEEELRQNMEELQATLDLEAKRAKEMERGQAQAEAQKQMMIRTIEKLKGKEQENQAQEEELRQNMEELQATLEQEARRTKEMERNSAQMEAQQQIMAQSLERFKKQEAYLTEQLHKKEKELIDKTNSTAL